jgi:hypothetical protein
VRIVAANADDQEERQLEIVDNIPQSIAGLEKARALDEDDGPPTAQEQAGRHDHGLALAADADQADGRLGQQSRLPRADLTIGNPDDIRNAAFFQGGNSGRTIQHRGGSSRG